MIRQTIYGPPGTGKTTRLMGLLENELNDTHPQSIAFVSFTRKGTYEGVGRAKEKFTLSTQDTRFFRTIHSLCFKALGMNRLDMITKEHYRILSEKIGIKFTGYYTEDLSSNNDIYLHTLSMEKHNPLYCERLKATLDMRLYERVRQHYEAMKKALRVYDFNDLLTLYLDHGDALPVKTAFIDEAQDLTPLQWKVVRKMFSSAEKIVVAGDDNQAVFEWSGADVSKFLCFSKDFTVLDLSYRLPQAVLDLSNVVVNDITVKKEKHVRTKKTAARYQKHKAIRHARCIASSQCAGALVLARTNYKLRNYAKQLRTDGVPYAFKGTPGHDHLILSAILEYNEREKMPMSPQAESYFHSLRGNWRDNVKLKETDLNYYELMIDRKTYNNEPIQLETFHSSKGSEKDHVVVDTTISKSVFEHFKRAPDAELRCLYVAVTRAKERLTLVHADDGYHYPYRYFQ